MAKVKVMFSAVLDISDQTMEYYAPSSECVAQYLGEVDLENVPNAATVMHKVWQNDLEEFNSGIEELLGEADVKIESVEVQ